MSTIRRFKRSAIKKENQHFNEFRSIIETAFYGNNVTRVETPAKAYELAKAAPNTIVTDIPVYQPEALGLPQSAAVLSVNDGGVVGRTASARLILGAHKIDEKVLAKHIREAVYQSSHRDFYTADVYVGLDHDFMVCSHLLLPKGYENNLYAYVLNFQMALPEVAALYQDSAALDESDIFIYCDPDWQHPDYPDGLAFFDPAHNAAAILGLRYFGELKKATLTLAWNIAHRNDFIACHGGMKQYQLASGKTYTMAAFGLSGSGKSTITLAKHKAESTVTVLHDDAFVISQKDGSTTALEPSYYDKTQDYPMDSEEVKYFLSVQNVGITLDEDGKKVLVTEDIRNGNGRTVKSHFATPNRVNHLKESVDAIYWIMKDDALPPLLKIDNPVLAAVFGATLATKRTTAENITTAIDPNKIVIEPYANPFRVYPLKEDYEDFRDVFQKQDVTCYILNTGAFGEANIPKEITLSAIDQIVEEKAQFLPLLPLKDIYYLDIPDFLPPLEDRRYLRTLKERMEARLVFLKEIKAKDEGYNALPDEAATELEKIIRKLRKALR